MLQKLGSFYDEDQRFENDFLSGWECHSLDFKEGEKITIKKNVSINQVLS